MTRDEFYKLTDILNSDVLGNFMHGGEADELIAMFEESVEHSNILEQEEPVSEDLEEEIKRNVYEPLFDLNGVAIKGATGYLTVEDVADIARHFANWQKERDEDEIRIIRELLDNFDKTCDEYHDAGFKHGQEALMKDALKVSLYADGDFLTVDYDFRQKGFNVGDRIKVLIVKEE